jgi:response regulator RpfG family c-di-GMP phosphodiesterase/DNA-binding CsgD family transcriptional regulator
MKTPQKSSFRLASALGAISIASDHASGQPLQSGLNTAVISVRLGKMLGLGNKDMAGMYYGCLCAFLGCTATAAESGAMTLGEDLVMNYAMGLCDWMDADDVERVLKVWLPDHGQPAAKAAAIAQIKQMVPHIPMLISMHCEQALALTARLPVPKAAETVMKHIFQGRWDGKAGGSKGKGIPITARIAALSQSVQMFWRIGGLPSVAGILKARGGRQLDPKLCKLATAKAPQLLAGLNPTSNWDLFLAAEPGRAVEAKPGTLEAAAGVCADLVDQKSPSLLGHSRRVSALASAAAASLGLETAEVEEVRLAGLVHDLGRLAVPNLVWDKAGALTPHEMRLAKGHSHHTETILASSEVFDGIVEAAASVHERCDGSGYHRRVRPSGTKTCLLAAADSFDALTHDRPWRKALSTEKAAKVLHLEAREGKQDPGAVDAVLKAAGIATRPARPAGVLTAREAEVLGLLAKGLATKQVADSLSISPKTADNHIQAIYEKTGARSRAAAAVYAIKHGIYPN